MEWLFVGGMLLALALAAGGFVVPWIVVDRGSLGSLTYSAVNLPVGNWLGMMWLGSIVLLGAATLLFKWRWTIFVGALSSMIGVATFLSLALFLREAPHLIPFWLIPKGARHYVPAIGSGAGPWLAFASSAVLGAWFIIFAVVRRRTAVGEGGQK